VSTGPTPGYGAGPVPPGAFRPQDAGAARVPLVYAEWWRRAAAAVVDGLVIGVIAGLVLAVLGVLGLSVDTGGGWLAFVLAALVGLVFVVVVSLFYAPLLMARTDGQTLGKMAAGIRVVRADGQRMDFAWATLREVVLKTLVVGVAASFTFGAAWLADVLWPLWDGEKRALHDFLVDTRVVRA